ncbi:maltose O-acetyltransferase [Lactobacillus selangorensis]|uniref:Acetyltransferase n=2 Tax=Lactobacillus selangorensis TaxID=81857 RepID=A0A0R2FJM4_9LACO|nr:maltose O-acetyltransferase [Lactobacillus selangorensis]KRN32749.1 maltose O-acetyltransferase [Lactobacillus selangorensis]
MISGKLYKASDLELAALNLAAKKRIYQYNHLEPGNPTEQAQLLAQIIDAPSGDAYVEPPFRADYGQNVHVGKRFYANYETIFLDIAPITIGDDAMFGPRVGLYTAGHPLVADIRNEHLEYGYPITIGNSVWLGGDVTVTPGVTIGDNVVIGAGSVVTKDIPSNVIAVGNPCHVLRTITAADHEKWAQQRKEYWEAMK